MEEICQKLNKYNKSEKILQKHQDIWDSLLTWDLIRPVRHFWLIQQNENLDLKNPAPLVSVSSPF